MEKRKADQEAERELIRRPFKDLVAAACPSTSTPRPIATAKPPVADHLLMTSAVTTRSASTLDDPEAFNFGDFGPEVNEGHVLVGPVTPVMTMNLRRHPSQDLTVDDLQFMQTKRSRLTVKTAESQPAVASAVATRSTCTLDDPEAFNF